jgi:hypothetical protein
MQLLLHKHRVLINNCTKTGLVVINSHHAHGCARAEHPIAQQTETQQNLNETWINALYLNFTSNTMRYQHVTGNNVN